MGRIVRPLEYPALEEVEGSEVGCHVAHAVSCHQPIKVRWVVSLKMVARRELAPKFTMLKPMVTMELGLVTMAAIPAVAGLPTVHV